MHTSTMGSIRDPRKSEFRDFLASITVGESRDITQATIGSIHFPAIHYFALFIGRCINGKDEACHMCFRDLIILRSAVLGDKSYTMDLEDFNTACKLPQWVVLVNLANLNIKTFLLV